jgi:hypothetical protein
MKKNTVKLVMYLNYFVNSALNSVGIVILKAQKKLQVDELQASVLEAFKDLPITIVSFDRVFYQESGINVQCLLG